MEEYKYKHFVFLDRLANVIDITSVRVEDPSPEGAIEIARNNDNYILPTPDDYNWGIWALRDTVFIPKYYYDFTTQTIKHRPQIDIDADYQQAKEEEKQYIPPPTEMERLEAQICYTAMMTDTLLQEEE